MKQFCSYACKINLVVRQLLQLLVIALYACNQSLNWQGDLEPQVSPAFAITYFWKIAIIVILDLKIHQSMWIHWPFFPKTWTKGHWPLDDLWPHVCWGHMCDSTHGSLCPRPMTIHKCMWYSDQCCKIPHTYTYYVLRTYYVQNEWSHSLLLNSVHARQKMTKMVWYLSLCLKS